MNKTRYCYSCARDRGTLVETTKTDDIRELKP